MSFYFKFLIKLNHYKMFIINGKYSYLFSMQNKIQKHTQTRIRSQKFMCRACEHTLHKNVYRISKISIKETKFCTKQNIRIS